MNRFDAQPNSRGGSPAGNGENFSPDDRGGNGADVLESNAGMGGVHSPHGFRKALMKSGSGGNRITGSLTDKTSFGGKGFKKPNYFAQGGQRHGMHVGAGAPVTQPAQAEGADFGE